MRPATRSAILLAALAGSIAGCGSGGRTAGADQPINAGLAALSRQQGADTPQPPPPPRGVTGPAPLDLEALANMAAFDIQQIGRDAAEPAQASAPPAPAPRPDAVTRTNDLAAADAAWGRIAATAVVAAPSPETQPAAPPPPEPAIPEGDRPFVMLAREIAGILRTRSTPGAAVMPDALALATLQALRPGVLQELDTPESDLRVLLSPDDLAALTAARDRVASDPSSLRAAGESLTKGLQRVAPAAELKIPRALLCGRVKSFGQYEALKTNTFPAGRVSRALVYVELDQFASREGGSGETKYTVELAQSLTLYRDPDGWQVWHQPAKPVVEASTSRRRDFYLVQQVEIPANLSIGAYRLKVSVTDKTTGALAEAIVPIVVGSAK